MLPGTEIVLLHFGRSAIVIVQFGMYGRLVLREPTGPHDHIALRLSGGRALTYADNRRFGAMHIWPTATAGENRPLKEAYWTKA